MRTYVRCDTSTGRYAGLASSLHNAELVLIRVRHDRRAVPAIARSVGLSAPSLYSYFPSVADLFTTLIVQSYESLANAVSTAFEEARSTSVEERLRIGPRAYRRWALDNRQAFNLVFFDQITGYEAPADGPTVAAQIAALSPIANEFTLAAGLEPGALLSPGEHLNAFLSWWGAYHGIVALEANHHLDWVDSEAVFERRLRIDIAQILSERAETGTPIRRVNKRPTPNVHLAIGPIE